MKVKSAFCDDGKENILHNLKNIQIKVLTLHRFKRINKVSKTQINLLLIKVKK